MAHESRSAWHALHAVSKANPRARALYERLGFWSVADTGSHHHLQFAGSSRAEDPE
jgi:hypothetical protein